MSLQKRRARYTKAANSATRSRMPTEPLSTSSLRAALRRPFGICLGGRQVHVDHPHGGEFLEHAARGQPRGQSMQTPAKGNVQAIRQEGDEDVGLDPRFELAKDRPDREIAPCFPRGRLLRVLKASSIITDSTRGSTAWPGLLRPCWCAEDSVLRASARVAACCGRAGS